MKGVIIHGGLLAVMLAYGYQTWTRDKSAKPTAGQVVMWNRSVADIKTVELQTKDRTLRLEPRGTGADAYWWGLETRTSKRMKPVPPPPPPADPSAPPPPPPPAEEETVTEEREFPIGDTGTKLVENLARMRAVKVVGTIKDDAKKDYGLDDTSKTVAVVFKDGSKTLVLGGSVFSGSDRYVMDVDTSKVFVVSREVVTPLEGGEGSLKPLDLRSFDPKDAKHIAIATPDKQKSVDRIKVKRPTEGGDPHAPPPGGKDDLIEAWGTGTTADQTAANFIDKVEKLRPTKFDSKVELSSLQPVVELTYRDGRGKQLGTIKLLKRARAQDEPQTVPADPDTGAWEYYLWTERTHVPGRVPALAADRVEQDLSTVFGDGAGAGAAGGSGAAAGTGSGSGAAAGTGSGSGSTAGSASGSAAGSAAGSGSGSGSAAGSAAGSGAGSATHSGSAAGSATHSGSAAGSASVPAAAAGKRSAATPITPPPATH